MDEYTLTLVIFAALIASNALGWWIGAQVERDKWRRRNQISWQLRNKARQDQR
jgi:cytochrome oxidase assembly protein ShyY1